MIPPRKPDPLNTRRPFHLRIVGPAFPVPIEDIAIPSRWRRAIAFVWRLLGRRRRAP